MQHTFMWLYLVKLKVLLGLKDQSIRVRSPSYLSRSIFGGLLGVAVDSPLFDTDVVQVETLFRIDGVPNTDVSVNVAVMNC